MKQHTIMFAVSRVAFRCMNRLPGVWALMCIILMYGPAHGSKHHIPRSQLDSLNVYSLLEQLESFPEFRVGAFDATDFAVTLENGNSLIGSGIVITYAGIPTGRYHDGITMPDLRQFLNSDIAAIEIYTGADKYEFCDQCDAVINIIPAKHEAVTTHIDAKTYVGSEIGDPTLYLQMLPSDSLEYNKEQVAVGELAGYLKTRLFSFMAGGSAICIDRYSDRDESRRSEIFKHLNGRSMNEHRTFILKGLFQSNDLSISVIPYLTNYNNFRFDQLAKRYVYYKGWRRGGQAALQMPIGSLGYADFSYAVTRDEARVGQAADSIGLTILASHFLSAKTKFFIRPALTLVSRLSLAYDQHTYLSADTAPSFAQVEHKPANTVADPVSWSVSLETATRLFNISANIAPGIRLWGEKQISSFGTIRWSASTQKGTSLRREIWEQNAGLEWRKEFAAGYSLNTSLAAKSTPLYPVNAASISFDRYRFSQTFTTLALHITAEAGLLGKGYLVLSPYAHRFGWSSGITWNGLNLKAGVNYSGESWWDNDINPVPHTALQRFPAACHLPAYFKGDIVGAYGLFSDRVRLSIAVKNLGKPHHELPLGSTVGPIIITNVKVLIGYR
jgi:hypothetical protein